MGLVPRMSRRSSTGSSRDKRASRLGGSRGKLLHLDAFSGIAGNMFLAAMLDLGLSRKQLDADLAGLGVDYKLRVSNVTRGALAARHLEVRVPGGAKPRKRAATKRPSAHGKKAHTHAHTHETHETHEPHDQGHAYHHVAPHEHSHGHGRRYREIRTLIEAARLEEPIRERALAIFAALADAEARVHGVAPDDVHFHEVGAVDAIVDVTGAAIALHRLGIERVTCTPVALGHGSVDTDHGLLPLPAPATLELLKGIPTVPAHVAWETVTPTGAAILRVVVDEFCALPAMTVSAIGYGAGNDRPGPMPNLLRAVLGESGGAATDRVVVLECNIDDLNPEHFDYLMERLFEAGALDVSLQNIQMKKNRPGFLVRVLARPAQRIALSELLFRESTTLGVRTSEWDRVVLERKSVRVMTPHGRIGIKLVRGLDGALQVSAEYDDCKRAAKKSGVPLRDVVRSAEDIARDEHT